MIVEVFFGLRRRRTVGARTFCLCSVFPVSSVVTSSQIVQRQPKKGRVVRVEHQSRWRLKPPGRGAFTQEELREWYDRHPNAKLDSVNLVNGSRTQEKAYTPEELWKRTYFYAITNVFGNSATEVWVNNDGDGKVIGIDREMP